MKINNCFILTFSLCTIIFYSCNTYIWQPTEKLLHGIWILNPDPDSTGLTEKWNFDNGCLKVTYWNNSILVNTKTYVMSRSNPTLTTCVDYNISNKIDRHFLTTDRWFLGNDPITAINADVPIWLIVKLDKKELYLSSEAVNNEGKSIKGDYQKGFVRE
ncbi:MAG: hypothetical protein IH946_02490 [Bacteroidetes bacterium]|nr:hypothetical protein [Bacteroidota bacterium]